MYFADLTQLKTHKKNQIYPKSDISIWCPNPNN